MDELTLAEQARAYDQGLPSRLIYLQLQDTLLAEQLSAQLNKFHYQAQCFHKQTQLIEALSIRIPDALITDLTGATKVKALLPEESCLLFVAEKDDLPHRLQAVRSGGKAFLSPPIDFNYLIEKLDGLILPKVHEPYRVLVVDDSPASAAFCADYLRDAGMEVTVLNQSLQIFDHLAHNTPDIILMDVYMPDCGGLELAQIIRDQDAYISIPIVFVSKEVDLKCQLNALLLGGDDFLSKPVHPYRLVNTVASRAARARELHALMIRDSLTGLLNHTSTLEQLEKEIASAKRLGHPLCFCMLDLDHFKKINDRFGHPIGDRVIKSLARLLRDSLRKTDTIGRYGGEEFAIILPATDSTGARHCIENILFNFNGIRHQQGDQSFKATFSAGIAQYQPEKPRCDLIEAADQALYQAKRHGRNQIALK